MTFRNQAVDLDALPSLVSLLLSPVSPRLAPCQALLVLVRWLVVTAVVLLFPVRDETLARWQPWLACGVGGVGLIAVALSWVEARRRAYGLREHDLVYRRGLLVRRTQVLPLVRLQHVETLSNPIERAFGLVRLACFTAGGRGADLVLEGLPAQRAEAVKQHLLARLGGAPPEQPRVEESP